MSFFRGVGDPEAASGAGTGQPELLSHRRRVSAAGRETAFSSWLRMLEPPRRLRLAHAIAAAGDSEDGRWDPVLAYSSPGLRHAPRRHFSEPRRDCRRTPEPNDEAFGYTRWAVDASSGETLPGPFLGCQYYVPPFYVVGVVVQNYR